MLYGKRSVPVTTESGRTRGVPRDVWKRDSLHGVPWRDVVETKQLPWSPMERCGGYVATSMESHGELSSGCEFWWTVTTAGIGMPWTLDQVKYLFLSVDD